MQCLPVQIWQVCQEVLHRLWALFALAFKNSINPIVSIIVGEFIITMIMSGLIVVGIPSTLQNLVIGVTLIVIILLTCKVERDAVVK